MVSLTVVLLVCQLLLHFSADLVQLSIIDIVSAPEAVHRPIVQLNSCKQRGGRTFFIDPQCPLSLTHTTHMMFAFKMGVVRVLGEGKIEKESCKATSITELPGSKPL